MTISKDKDTEKNRGMSIPEWVCKTNRKLNSHISKKNENLTSKVISEENIEYFKRAYLIFNFY